MLSTANAGVGNNAGARPRLTTSAVTSQDGLKRFHVTFSVCVQGWISCVIRIGRLVSGYTLFEDSRRAQKRGRRQGSGRQNERTAHRRAAVRQELCSQRWPEDPPSLCVRGEEAGGVEISGRRLQAARDHSGG